MRGLRQARAAGGDEAGRLRRAAQAPAAGPTATRSPLAPPARNELWRSRGAARSLRPPRAKRPRRRRGASRCGAATCKGQEPAAAGARDLLSTARHSRTCGQDHLQAARGIGAGALVKLASSSVARASTTPPTASGSARPRAPGLPSGSRRAHMDGLLSRGSVDFSGVSGVVGGHGGAGRFPGRHELKVRRVRPVWSGSYARAGYLKTLVRRRARILRAGAAQPGGRVAHSPCSRARGWRRGGLLVARARPGSRRRAVWMSCGGQSRVAASQQNAASSRAQAIATVPVRLPRSPARCVQRACRRRWRAMRSATTRGSWPAWRAARLVADRGPVTVVVCGLDQQPPRMRRAGLGDLALHALLVEVYSLGTMPRNPDSRAGLANRSKLPTSAHNPAAVSVSIPRKQRNLAIVCAWLLSPARPPRAHRSARGGAARARRPRRSSR